MSQTKYNMPDDLKMLCIGLVRGYKRRVILYQDRRDSVIYGSPLSADGMPKGNQLSDSTTNKVLELEKIEHLIDTRAMRAVEQARVSIGVDCEKLQRQRLADAIWDSCIEGRNFTFEYYDLPMGKTNFYERRRGFLYNIAKYMEFM